MMQIENQENYIADQPVHESSKDCFQRYGFSKRIAETIIQRKTDESIVIGIYGDWGEGKTSVLNFIEEALSINSDIIVCKFNPWRFKDETQLLTGFFNLLANKLKKTIKTKGEKISTLISEYADVVAPLEGLTKSKFIESVKKITTKHSTIDIEEQKKRIEKILADEKKRVVIFIDDIDRLDKKEIQAVFKLVKLTGDFSFTSYVLAFDEKMVAKAIGEIYEDGDEQSGKNFLEKIIQVPLRLPLAQKDALKKFCFEQVDNAIRSNNIELTEDEARRFVDNFTSSFLFRLSTPRMAIRYGNALSFSLPLLYKEANIVDLILIEAVKVFYPELYVFIRDNSSKFLSAYSNRDFASRDNSNENRKKEFKDEISVVLRQYTEKEKNLIKDLLIDLFPILNEVYGNYVHGEHNFKEWYTQKRIGSGLYFQRYFSYTVIEGEISDVVFDAFLNQIKNGVYKENVQTINEFVSKTGGDSFISKLRWNEGKYTTELSIKLAQSLAASVNAFLYRTNSLFGFDSPLGQVTYFIFQLISKISDQEKQFILAMQIFKESRSFNFMYELLYRFEYKDSQTNKAIFTTEQYNELAIIFLNKVKDDAGNEPIFVKHPQFAHFVLSDIWGAIQGKDSLMGYIRSILDREPNQISQLLKAYSPFVHSSSYPEPYYGDIEQRHFDAIPLTFDVDYLFDIAVKAFGEGISEGGYKKLKHQQTEENRVKQFVYLYKRFKEEQDKGEGVNDN